MNNKESHDKQWKIQVYIPYADPTIFSWKNYNKDWRQDIFALKSFSS